MIIITSPSKTQQIQGTPLPHAYQDFTIPPLLAESEKIIAALKKLNREELGKLLKTSPALTESAYHLLQSFSTPFSPPPAKNCEAALRLFQGDAYGEIDAENYTAKESAYAQKHLRILCGLYGVLRPLDLVQPYRLEMQSRLTVGGCKNLYQFWGEKINSFLLAELDGKPEKERIIINLASTEYSKIIDTKRLKEAGGRLLTIFFQQPNKKAAGEYKTIPIYAKRARGMMIDYMIKRELDDAEKLQEFTRSGYRYREEESTAEKWLFQMGKVPN